MEPLVSDLQQAVPLPNEMLESVVGPQARAADQMLVQQLSLGAPTRKGNEA